MASSGSTTKVIRGEWYLRLQWRQVSQSITNNTTTVEAKLYWGCNRFGNSGSSTQTGSISIDGQSGAFSSTMALSSGQEKLLGTVTKTVTHENDGNKSITISASQAIALELRGTYIASESLSLTASLNTIPRVSQVTPSAWNAGVYGVITLYTNRKSSSLTHTLTWSVGGVSGTIGTNVGESIAWAIPMTVAEGMPGAASGGVTIKCTTYSGSTNLGSTSIGIGVSLPYSPISVSSNSANIGNIITVTSNRYSTRFLHILYLKVGSYKETLSSNMTDTHANTMSASLANHAPNSTSATVTFILETYHGTAYLGKSEKNVTLAIPNTDAFQPSISFGDIVEGYDGMGPVIWFAQYHTKFKVTSNASATYGSGISEVRIRVDGKNYYGTDITTDTINLSGDVPIELRVTNTRGYSKYLTAKRKVFPYHPPRINKFLVSRGDRGMGENLQINVFGEIAPIGSSNGRSILIKYREKGAYSWTTLVDAYDVYSLNETYNYPNVLDGNKSYEVMFYIADYFTSIERIVNVGSVYQLININESGRGIAFGKVSQKDAMEIELPLEVMGKKVLTEDVIQFGGDASNGWVKYGNGIMFQWAKEYVNVTFGADKFGPFWKSSEISLNFPVPFVGTPQDYPKWEIGNMTDSITINKYGPSNVRSTRFTVASETNSNGGGILFVFAIGRWK